MKMIYVNIKKIKKVNNKQNYKSFLKNWHKSMKKKKTNYFANLKKSKMK